MTRSCCRRETTQNDAVHSARTRRLFQPPVQSQNEQRAPLEGMSVREQIVRGLAGHGYGPSAVEPRSVRPRG